MIPIRLLIIMIKYLSNTNQKVAKMKYENVWNAVDKLATSRGLSPSGLAKLAGLDATTFNKSKRIRPDGKNRWPSLDSINKLLDVCSISFEQFYNLSDSEEEKEGCSIPFTKLSKLEEAQEIEDKMVKTPKWNKVLFPDLKEAMYAIEIDTNDYAPLYRNGSMIVLAGNSDIRKGDRVAIFCTGNQLMLKEFIRRTPSKLVLNDINNDNIESTISISDVRLINRIIWASQ